MAIVARLRSLAIGIVIAFVASLVLVSGARDAWAGDSAEHKISKTERTKFDELKAEGDSAMASGRPTDAISAYDAAYAIDPQVTLRYNKGRALLALARYPAAYDELVVFRDSAPEAVKSRVPGLDALIDDVAGRVATLEIRANVDGAEARIDGKPVGKTPTKPTRVNAGQSRIEVSKSGFVTFSKTVDLPGKETTTVYARLEPVDTRGALSIRVTPADATIRVDRRVVGSSPIDIRIARGNHTVLAERDGYEPKKTSVFIETAQPKRVDLTLDKKPGLLSKWWFWAAAGTIVAAGAGAASYVALTTERDPDQGSIPPGIITSP